MALRYRDTERWRTNAWWRKIGRDERDLFDYLVDNCDIGGFMPYDEDLVALDLKMEVEKVQGAMEGLCRPFKGSSKVLLRPKVGSSEVFYIWLRNFVKVQLKGTSLNGANAYHKGVWAMVEKGSELFPESKKLYSLTSRPLVGPSKGLRRVLEKEKEKERENLLLGNKRECEREKGGGGRFGGSEMLVRLNTANADVFRISSENYENVKRACPYAVESDVVEHLERGLADMVDRIKNPYAYLLKVFQGFEHENSEKPDLDESPRMKRSRIWEENKAFNQKHRYRRGMPHDLQVRRDRGLEGAWKEAEAWAKVNDRWWELDEEKLTSGEERLVLEEGVKAR